MKKKGFVILGTVVGLGVAASTFFASKKGKEMQKNLTKNVNLLQEKLKDIEMSDLKQALSEKIEDVKTSINEFDWEFAKEDVSTTYFELKDKLSMIKDHIDLAKIKLEDDETPEKDFDLVIDKTTTEKLDA